jgi:hypothetical protein
VIPDLGLFPAAWLAGAELSLAVGRPERVGLSLFSTDTAAFSAFCDQIALPPAAREEEERLRALFDLVPRHWLKLHYLAGERTGFSQYFTIHGRNGYPITTLRLFARQYGAREAAGLEALLRPALEREDTTWFVTLKRVQQAAEPRISCRLPRVALPELMATVVVEGYVDPRRADQYLAWDRRLETGDDLYVTFDPLRQELCCLDFEDPHPCSLPGSWEEAATDFTDGATPRYLKCRLRAGAARPEWVIYLACRPEVTPSLSRTSPE